MKNVTTSVDENGILTIRIDTKHVVGPSKSGKTNVVASTLGNVPIPGAPADFRIGVNAYVLGK
jgi:hypothetical protein